MISQEYMCFDDIFQGLNEGSLCFSYPLKRTIKEIKKLRDKIPKTYDKIACILKVSRPLTELVLHRMGYEEHNLMKDSPGRPKISITTHLIIHFLGQTYVSDSYRQLEREIYTHQTWLWALGLKKSPDHTTMSKFRKKMGSEFFDTYFHELTKLLLELGLVKKGDDFIIDSAPVEASQNFARSNSGISIDKTRLQAFYDTIDFSPALEMIAPHSKLGRARKYSDETILRYIAYEKLCGFLSRSQAIKYLKKNPKVAKIIGFPNDDTPSSTTINATLKRIPPIPFLMRQIVEPITDFFDAQEAYDDRDPLHFFFRKA